MNIGSGRHGARGDPATARASGGSHNETPAEPFLSLFVPGHPRGQTRPRFDPRTGRVTVRGGTEGARRSHAWRESIASVVREEWGSRDLVSSECALFCAFYSLRPKAHFRRSNGMDVLKHDAPQWRAAKPDLDNLAKNVMDALNGIVLVDDRQIVDLRCVSLYWSRPGVFLYLCDAALNAGTIDGIDRLAERMAVVADDGFVVPHV